MPKWEDCLFGFKCLSGNNKDSTKEIQTSNVGNSKQLYHVQGLVGYLTSEKETVQLFHIQIIIPPLVTLSFYGI